MEDILLCSRSEISRSVDLDTGKNIAVVGAPKDFVKWLDRILPTDSLITDDVDSLLEKGSLDRMIVWISGTSISWDDVIELLKRHGESSIWIVHDSFDTEKERSYPSEIIKIGETLPLTPDQDLSRISLH